MFTGIIEEKSKVLEIKKTAKSLLIKVAVNLISDDLAIGDSVSTNGVCLTVKELGTHFFTADVMNETVKRTNLKDLRTGDFVNLERALTLSTRLGGHIVSGHIDGMGMISRIENDDIAKVYSISTTKDILRYIIKKGSVAIDGISLTVVDVDETSFKVSIIPHTLENTILIDKKVGSSVNIENDMMAKYIEKFQREESVSENSSKLSESFLKLNGF